MDTRPRMAVLSVTAETINCNAFCDPMFGGTGQEQTRLKITGEIFGLTL